MRLVIDKRQLFLSFPDTPGGRPQAGHAMTPDRFDHSPIMQDAA
jgi:hypothetical protein